MKEQIKALREDLRAGRQTELRLQRLNRLHTVLSKIAESIVRARDRLELYESVCRIVVEDGLLRMAFVAEVDVQAKAARPVAAHGAGQEFLLDAASIFPLDGGPLSMGTVGTAIRTGLHDVCNDIAGTARMKPWHAATDRNGLLANASFPLKMHGDTIAALVLYAGEKDYFQNDEIDMMVTVAGNLSFALESLEKERHRRHAEESLRESEERFRNIFNATATGIALSTPQGRFLQANAAYCMMLGYTESELQSLNFAALTHPDDLSLNLKLRDEVLAGRRDSFVMDKRYLKKDGQTVWTRHSVSGVRGARGEITMFIVVAENVTERKRAEEQLLWKTAFLEAQVNSSLDGILVVNSTGIKILQNQRMVDLWNIPAEFAEEFNDKRQLEWVASQVKNPDAFTEKVTYLYAHPDEVSRDNLELINGKYIERYSAPVKGRNGEYYGRIWVFHDITERKRAEEQLLWKTAFLEAQVNSALDAMMVVDSKGQKILQNQKMVDLWNIPADIADEPDHRRRLAWLQSQNKYPELFAAKVAHLYAHPDEVSRDVLELVSGKFIDRYSAPVKGKDGTYYGRIWIYRDITGKRLAEDALRQSEERLRLITDLVPHGIFAKDGAGRHIFVNPAMAEIAGLSIKKILGKTDFELVADKAQAEAFQAADRAVIQSGNKKLISEEARTDLSGRTRLLQIIKVPFILPEADELGVLGVCIDISERKRAEMALQLQQSELRALFDLIPAMVWFKDTKNNILRVNRRVAEATGKSIEEIEGKSSLELYPQEAAKYYADDLAVIESGEPKLGIIEKLHDSGGKERWVQTDKVPYRDMDGKVVGIVVMAQDLTERKRLETRFRRLVDSNAQVVFFWNMEGRITDSNDAFLKLTHYTREDLEAGRINWAAMTPPEYNELDRRAREEIEAKGFCTAYEKEWVCKDGTRVPILIGAANFEDNPNEGVCFVLDLTERKKLEQQLRQSQKMDAIGQLAGGIAHDFNNLLTVINGYSDVLIGSLPPDDPSQTFLGFIKDAGEQSSALTRQLLAFSKNQFLSPKPLDLNEVVRKVERMLQRIIGEDIRLSVVAGSDLGSVMADQTQIEQILLNLAVNARDAMEKGGNLTIETRRVDLDESYASTHVDVKPGPYVMLAVTDSGTGIPEEVRRHIFEPFFTTKGVGKGTGLGLAVVHGIVKQSEGSIEVYSEPGQGTCFKIYLPQIACAVAAETPAAHEKAIRPGSETILLVEDEASVREFARHVLEGYGYTILTAGNAQEALQISAQHATPIHLLLTDVVMPGTGGRVLAEQLQPTRPQMKVLFMSGYTEDAVVRHGILHEEVNFLQKPYSPLALAQKVREVLQ